MATEGKGMMFVLSSPSGAGKTTLTKKLAAKEEWEDFMKTGYWIGGLADVYSKLCKK